MQYKRWTDTLIPSAKNNIICVASMLLLWHCTFLKLFNTDILTEESMLSWGHFACIAICSIVLLRMNDVFMFIRVRTYLPMLFFIITGGLLLPQEYHECSAISLALILSLYSTLRLTQTENMANAFNTGLLIAVASILYPPSVLFFLPYLITAFNFNLPFLKTLLAYAIGFSVPCLYYSMFYFYKNGNLNIDLNFELGFYPELTDNLYTNIFIAFIGVFTIISLTGALTSLPQENIRPRRIISLLINTTATTSFIMLFLAGGIENLQVFAIAMSALFLGRTFSVNYDQNRIVRIMFWLLLITSLTYFIIKNYV